MKPDALQGIAMVDSFIKYVGAQCGGWLVREGGGMAPKARKMPLPPAHRHTALNTSESALAYMLTPKL